MMFNGSLVLRIFWPKIMIVIIWLDLAFNKRIANAEIIMSWTSSSLKRLKHLVWSSDEFVLFREKCISSNHQMTDHLSLWKRHQREMLSGVWKSASKSLGEKTLFIILKNRFYIIIQYAIFHRYFHRLGERAVHRVRSQESGCSIID